MKKQKYEEKNLKASKYFVTKNFDYCHLKHKLKMDTTELTKETEIHG